MILNVKKQAFYKKNVTKMVSKFTLIVMEYLVGNYWICSTLNLYSKVCENNKLKDFEMLRKNTILVFLFAF